MDIAGILANGDKDRKHMQTIARRMLNSPLRAAGRFLPAGLIAVLAILGAFGSLFVKPWAPGIMLGLGRLGGIMVCLLSLVVARALVRGKRQAWLLSIGLLGLLLAEAILNRGMRFIIPITAVLLLGFIVLAPMFRRRSDPAALVWGYLSLALALAALFGHEEIYDLIVFAHLPPLRLLIAVHIATVFVLGIGVIEILRPVAPGRSIRRADSERAARIVNRHATRSLAHYTLGPNMSYYWAASGQAYLAYRVHRGVAIVLGDPVGRDDETSGLVQQFLAFCRKQDWQLAIYQAGPATLSCLTSAEFHAIKVGEEAIVNTTAFTLQGRVGAPVRHAIARARRGNLTVSLWHGTALPDRVFDGMKRVSAEWLQQHHTPTQMGFSMGRFPADWSNELLTVVAFDEHGEVEAFLTWTPLYRGNGWTLDNMRRRQQTTPGAMEYLIAESIEWARARGFGTMSLSLAPLAGVSDELKEVHDVISYPRFNISAPARLVQRSAAYLHRRGILLGNYRSLYFFKQKFQPTWEPRYLVLTDVAALPRVLIALAVVHGMGWRALARDAWTSVRTWRSAGHHTAT